MSTRLATLARRAANALRYLVHGTPMPVEPNPVSRVGLLNNGQLIIVLPGNGSGVLLLSEHTTDLVRDVLERNTDSFDMLPLTLGTATASADPVHQVLREAGR